MDIQIRCRLINRIIGLCGIPCSKKGRCTSRGYLASLTRRRMVVVNECRWVLKYHVCSVITESRLMIDGEIARQEGRTVPPLYGLCPKPVDIERRGRRCIGIGYLYSYLHARRVGSYCRRKGRHISVSGSGVRNIDERARLNLGEVRGVSGDSSRQYLSQPFRDGGARIGKDRLIDYAYTAIECA